MRTLIVAPVGHFPDCHTGIETYESQQTLRLGMQWVSLPGAFDLEGA
jgi:hypothetical protein